MIVFSLFMTVLIQVTGSAVIHNTYKIRYRSVSRAFSIFRELAGGKLPLSPVMADAFTADPLLTAGVAAVAVFHVL